LGRFLHLSAKLTSYEALVYTSTGPKETALVSCGGTIVGNQPWQWYDLATMKTTGGATTQPGGGSTRRSRWSLTSSRLATTAPAAPQGGGTQTWTWAFSADVKY
jgi:hypothetical protein